MKKTIFLAAAIVAMTACNKNVIEMAPAEGFGYIDLGITADTEMVITKGITTDADLTGYNITLTGSIGPLWTSEFENIDDSNWMVPAGNYSIYVENLNVGETYTKNNGIGVVRVSGETTVTVTAGVSAPCTVACTPQNSKVSFMYSEDFDTVFDNPSVSVMESEERTINMTVGSTHLEANAAYFETNALTWTLTAELNGQTKTYTKTFIPVKAKWTQITFTTGSTDGEINVTITVDGEIDEVYPVTAVVNPFSGDVEVTPAN